MSDTFTVVCASYAAIDFLYPRNSSIGMRILSSGLAIALHASQVGLPSMSKSRSRASRNLFAATIRVSTASRPRPPSCQLTLYSELRNLVSYETILGMCDGRRQPGFEQGPRTAAGTGAVPAPYRLSLLSNTVSNAIARSTAISSGLKHSRKWRVMAVLGRFGPLTASEVGERTAMDKVSVSRAALG